MRAQVNGETRELADGVTVADIVELFAVAGPRGIAVALEGTVVSRSVWSDTIVPEGARLEILSAVGGG